MPTPTLSLVMPVHNGAHFLPASLAPLRAELGRDLLELWVVDDASDDGSGAVAEQFGAKVLRSGHQIGPGAARNLAAELARGDVLVFVDADVVIHPGMLGRVREAMTNPARTAVFGSYDDLPAESNLPSLYMNLRHHMMHQRNAGSTHNFWSGFGAVRRGAFLDLGGFDGKTFPEPNVEDIEFGHRLARSGGRTLLDPGLLCTHLKHWTLRSLVHTDCVHRALPWSRLLIRNGSQGMALNVSRAERGRAIVAVSALIATLMSLAGALSWWSTVPLIVATLLLTRGLTRLLYRRAGVLSAASGALYHQVYYLYSTVIYGSCWLSALGRRLISRRALRA